MRSLEQLEIDAEVLEFVSFGKSLSDERDAMIEDAVDRLTGDFVVVEIVLLPPFEWLAGFFDSLCWSVIQIDVIVVLVEGKNGFRFADGPVLAGYKVEVGYLRVVESGFY